MAFFFCKYFAIIKKLRFKTEQVKQPLVGKMRSKEQVTQCAELRPCVEVRQYMTLPMGALKVKARAALCTSQVRIIKAGTITTPYNIIPSC